MSKQDVIIIGGGIMGLMTAYYASQKGRKVMIMEKYTIGNKKAASFSYTRSIRNDYLDPYYVRLAQEARKLWEKLENKSKETFILNCGCLNLTKKSISSDIEQTYGMKAFKMMQTLKVESKKFSKTELQERYPQFDADAAFLDVRAGFLYLPVITNFLIAALKKRKVQILENVIIQKIQSTKSAVKIKYSNGEVTSKSVVITAGIWVNDVLKLIDGKKYSFPIVFDKPQECKYIIPKNSDDFIPYKLPVFAYLDVGIYGHPWYKGKTKGVKIGFYNPPDFKKKEGSKINSINDFIQECMPSLKKAKVEDVKDADQCFYDLVEDDNFILGQLSDMNIFVGAGWRGTGYKFAPLVGKILSELADKQKTTYDISKFDPDRFKQL